ASSPRARPEMRLQRIAIAELEGLGGAAGVAAHLRTLIADAGSVERDVSEIVQRVRAQGDAALLDYTRRFDATGAEPKPLVVAPQELDEAIKELALDVVAGLQVTIANVAQVADAAVGEGRTVALAQGQQIALREIPVASAAVYVPGGR